MIFVLVYFRALPGQGCQLYAKAGAHYWAPGKDDGAFRFSRTIICSSPTHSGRTQLKTIQMATSQGN